VDIHDAERVATASYEEEGPYSQWEESYTEGDDGSLQETYLLDPDEDFDEEDLLFAENAFSPSMWGSPIPKDGLGVPDVPEWEMTDDAASTDPYEVIDGGKIYYPPEDPPTLPSEQLRDADVAGGFATSADDEPYDEVEEPLNWEIGDLEIAEHVRRALRLHAETQDLSIRVQVVDGVATLRGRVRTMQDVALAEDVASEVEGVEEVREQLTVD
jgi:hypothetical protein